MNERTEKDLTKELAEELDVFDDMFSVLIDLLEQKGILKREEFEERMRARMARAKGTTSYRELQFQNK